MRVHRSTGPGAARSDPLSNLLIPRSPEQPGVTPARGDGREWWQDAVLYQVYPRSFQDSNGDGVGDLRGILDRLDYLNDGTPDSLGVDAIWLAPVFPSPMRDLGYDVADYCDIDPLFGDLDAFDALVAGCHARGIRVLIDFVLNHTSDQHAWFRESRQSRDGDRRDWYIWRDPASDGGPPNDWHAVFGGSAWTFEPARGQYYLHTFLREQPDLNWSEPAVVMAMQDALRFWLARGVDGVRLDAVAKLVKHFDGGPSAADGTSGAALKSLAGSGIIDPEAIRYVRLIRSVIDEFPGRVALAEAYAKPERLAILYGGAELDGVHLAFNFQFIRVTSKSPLMPWDAAALGAAIEETEAALPPGALSCFAFSNHDVPRFRSRHDADGRGLERARAAVLLQLSLRGVPCLYYGDELGMRDTPVQAHERFDPSGRDPARTPMPWDDSSGRGFTGGTPWLPFGDDLDAESQAVDAASMLSLYRRALWLRREEPALQAGSVRVLRRDGDVLVTLREAADARPVLMVLNTAAEDRLVAVPPDFRDTLLGTSEDVEVRDSGEATAVFLPPLAAAWLVP